jgi:hypothetical protein
MTNHHTKFEVPTPKGSLVIDRKPFGTYVRLTDGRTTRRLYAPPNFFGEHKNGNDGKPGVIIVTMKTVEDKDKVLKNKNILKNNPRYRNV